MYSINFLPGSKMMNSYFLAGFLTYSCLDRLPIFLYSDSGEIDPNSFKSLQLRVQPLIFTGFPFIVHGETGTITKKLYKNIYFYDIPIFSQDKLYIWAVG
jgi:hypothetical protein